MTQPVSDLRLQQIATDACDSALERAFAYEHDQTEGWNSEIITRILKALISESTPEGKDSSPFKFAVNSTIIQHLASPMPNGTDGNSGAQDLYRRGMHSAAGAYWNNKKDGMWSTKYEGGGTKGMDVVISVIWVSS